MTRGTFPLHALLLAVALGCGGTDRRSTTSGGSGAAAPDAGGAVPETPEAGALEASAIEPLASSGAASTAFAPEPPPPGWDELPPPVVGEDEQEEPGRPLAIDERIADDREAGRLDAKTAAFYQLLLQFAPDRLPEPYQQGDSYGSLPSIRPLLAAQAHLEEYGPVEQAAVKAMLTDPEDPAWMVFPTELGVRNAAPGPPTCRQNFLSGGTPVARYLGPPIDTVHFRIRALLPAVGDVPGQDRLLGRLNAALDARVPDVGGGAAVPMRDYLDHVYDHYKTALRMKEPSRLAKVAANGGRVPLYVTTCDGTTNDAFAAADGYIFVSAGMAFEDEILRRIIIPHELFHLFEYAYTTSCVEGEDWPYEASAVAVEDIVAPDVRRWSGKYKGRPVSTPHAFDPMDRSFKCPEEPLYAVKEGPCKNRGGSSVPRYGGDYSKFVLVKFLMRNRGLGLDALWQSMQAAGGVARDLVTEQEAAEFQLALVGDPSGGRAFFDAEDRAAFFTAGRDSPDFGTQILNRYTWRLDPAQLAQSDAFRATPEDGSSKLYSDGLRMLDSRSLPVQPWGTHRLLLEVPPQASQVDEADGNRPRIHLMLKFRNGSAVSYSILSLGDGDQPARSYGLEFPHRTNQVPQPVTKTTYAPLPNEAPRYALVVITNLGDAPLRYEGSVNLPGACLKACADHYVQTTVRGRGCIEDWCWTDCSDTAEPDGCEAGIRRCIQDHRATARYYVDGRVMDGTPGGMIGLCPFFCNPLSGLDQPVPPSRGDDCSRWDRLLCGGACPSDKPAAFVRLRNWPAVECREIATGGRVRCD